MDSNKRAASPICKFSRCELDTEHVENPISLFKKLDSSKRAATPISKWSRSDLDREHVS